MCTASSLNVSYNMKTLSLIIIFLITIYSKGVSQIDTLAIHDELNNFQKKVDHIEFWKKIYRIDQHYRGKDADKSKDVLNMVRASMYFNKFGYPTTEKAGEESSIINYVWIHNSTPKIREITFNIIFESYLERKISEDEFRNYYLRAIYSKKYNDNGYKIDSIKSLLRKINYNFSKRINIEDVLTAYRKGLEFLDRDYKEYGMWIGETTYDTLYYNESPIIQKRKPDPIRIFQDAGGVYYIQYLFEDKSYFPRKIIKENDNTFRHFKDSKSYYRVLYNGELEVCNELGRKSMYTPS